MSQTWTSTSARIRNFAIGAAFAGFGSLLIWITLADLVPFGRDITSNAKLVALEPMDVRGLGIGFACVIIGLLAFAVLFAKPISDGRNKGRPDPRDLRWFGVGLSVAIIIALFGLLGGSIVGFVVDRMLVDRGYRFCPTAYVNEPHPPLRWARSDGACP